MFLGSIVKRQQILKKMYFLKRVSRMNQKYIQVVQTYLKVLSELYSTPTYSSKNNLIVILVIMIVLIEKYQ